MAQVDLQMMLQQQAEAEQQRQFAAQQQQVAEQGRNARESAKLQQKTMQPIVDQEAQIAGDQQRQQEGLE